MPEVRVDDEFATLRTVIVSRSELGLPDTPPETWDTDFLGSDVARAATPGADLDRDLPDLARALRRERGELSALLESHGVEVLHPRPLTAHEKEAAQGRGYANFFVRDPLVTIGNLVIEGSLRFPYRRGEVLPVRDLLRERVDPADSVHVAVPAPEVPEPGDASLGEGPFLEGGDVLVLGRRILVGVSGLATNTAGVSWLRKFLAPHGYTVETVRLHPRMLHLDCALGLVREGLMIVCEEALLDGVPESLRPWRSVPVSFDQATALATNGLPLSPDTYVTDPEFTDVGERLEALGVRVEYVDLRATRSLGGAFRCSTQPLLRHG
ncbi:dimethylarginine dimethylaminohydrolase family protein [Nocardiopsis sp. NPDC058789]|uniref:dimethylarginine dimethylaminohydrolase family protein n=1 Tax=Nocardiopsis sp. NPDC058789 TaxID=3346634 RepID=UPI00366FC9CA